MGNLNFIKEELVESVRFYLLEYEMTVSAAESCTGGFVSHCLTSKKRSSNYFKGAVIAYDNEIKKNFLKISQCEINKYGVVSKYVAELMAKAIREKFNTDFGFATTGYVDIYYKGNKKYSNLYAWVSISSNTFVNSKLVNLTGKRTENISIVTNELFKLFRKEII